MTNHLLEQYWEQLELQFEQVSKALAVGDAVSVAEYSAILQQLTVEFMGFLDSDASTGAPVSEVRTRIQRLASRLPALRESLHRRHAQAEMALSTLVPTAPAATYGARGSKTQAAVYGTIPRKTGTFQVIST